LIEVEIKKSKTSTMSAENKNYSNKSIAIPCEVMTELAQIIIQADLPHEIIGVREAKGQIIMRISYQPNLKFHQQAIENIDALLEAFKDLHDCEQELYNWREEIL
jgi:hypothetical protein